MGVGGDFFFELCQGGFEETELELVEIVEVAVDGSNANAGFFGKFVKGEVEAACTCRVGAAYAPLH